MALKSSPIVIGADHYGLALKNALRDYMCTNGYEVVDMGVTCDNPVDYPDVALAVAEQVRSSAYERGVLICGTGAGMAIVANKVPGVRAVAVYDPYTAERARASNNAQIITLGAQVTGPETAKRLVQIWLDSEFQPARSAAKVDKIDKIDEFYRRARELEGG